MAKKLHVAQQCPVVQTPQVFQVVPSQHVMLSLNVIQAIWRYSAAASSDLVARPCAIRMTMLKYQSDFACLSSPFTEAHLGLERTVILAAAQTAALIAAQRRDKMDGT